MKVFRNGLGIVSKVSEKDKGTSYCVLDCWYWFPTEKLKVFKPVEGDNIAFTFEVIDAGDGEFWNKGETVSKVEGDETSQKTIVQNDDQLTVLKEIRDLLQNWVK